MRAYAVFQKRIKRQKSRCHAGCEEQESRNGFGKSGIRQEVSGKPGKSFHNYIRKRCFVRQRSILRQSGIFRQSSLSGRGSRNKRHQEVSRKMQERSLSENPRRKEEICSDFI